MNAVADFGISEEQLRQLADPWWRLTHLYKIVDEDANELSFTPNPEQENLYRQLHYWNLILKARQLGFTTLLAVMALDQCLFNKNFRAAIIFHNLDDAEKAFRLKIKYAYDHLPDGVRAMVGVSKETSTEMVFDNGSTIGVGVSARSGTIQWLHISEFGKICAKFPEKAREVVTGSFAAVPKDGLIFVESTAEGQSGYFYDYCMESLRRQAEGRKAARGQWKLHFYPWWAKPSYVNDDPSLIIDGEFDRYFTDLEKHHGIRLREEQKRWYVSKALMLGDDMKREFPSYPEEAFEQAIKGAIYARQMAALRGAGRITDVPYDPSVPVNTFWDLGTSVGNSTAVWLHQRAGIQNRFIGFHQAEGEDLTYFVRWLESKKYVFGTHYLPHDATANMQGRKLETRADILRELGLKDQVIVRRVDDIGTGIERTRAALASCWFDKKECAEGIRMLDSYQYEWDDARGIFTRKPLHNFASNGADAFRQFGQGYFDAGPKGGKKFKRHRSDWRA